MANEMDGLEEDAAMSEIDFLCQENKAFRGRLEELTKELADSEEKRVILPQEMYKLPPSVLLFVMSDLDTNHCDDVSEDITHIAKTIPLDSVRTVASDLAAPEHRENRSAMQLEQPTAILLQAVLSGTRL
ncbi:hypothetical protein B0A54_17423 [Friedmanniomyces endolithicus]|uniref:Uncharacterized protein n=1 Tax=Friedmanniomyces endolithicus TaxID=329885 RepID=A0A4V5N3Z7_9PEZI|nr:hypothetical protein B0A54_17423 [Friedmanniomyces endolithicus]